MDDIEILRDAARYRWLRKHAKRIVTDQQWQVMPSFDDDQKAFLDELIDAELDDD